MENETNNTIMKPPAKLEDAANRPFCVFYVHQAMPKAIHADTVMASDAGEAERITAENHKGSMILHVRSVGSDDDANDPAPLTGSGRRPPLEGLPGARFINGEFRAASCQDELELDALGD